jgi:hypothetical protein
MDQQYDTPEAINKLAGPDPEFAEVRIHWKDSSAFS